MSIEDINIRKLRRNLEESDFQVAYYNLLRNNESELDDSDLHFLLKLAIIFLSYGDYSLAKLGYRIILRYSNVYDDYQPLYDISINKGYIPISKFIETQHFSSETLSRRFFNTFLSAYKDNFLNEGIYLSLGQKILVDFSRSNDSNFVLIAPTSYGKSEIIITKVLSNLTKKICIIVPSKALLAQTKRRLLSNPNIASQVKRIITHPEMYRGTEENFVAVLTQERLLRLLQKNPSLAIELVLLDEAHNLLKSDPRATLLAQVILILIKRNSKIVLNFFTPFVADGDSLKIPYAEYSLPSQNTTEYLKVERYYYCNLITDGRLYMYDQFIDKSITYNERIHRSDIGFVLRYKSKKNIVYLNKPSDIEKAARALSNTNVIQITQKIQEALNAIADFLHPAYNLLQCIRSGVVYHHGGMPDVIRLYVENLFSSEPALEFIVTNSTLLEGVNIPAEKIFLLSIKIGNGNLSKAQFKNLIGRVCRFSEIFNSDRGNLNLLEPEIYLLKGDYADSRSNLASFLKTSARSDRTIEDDVENIMLMKNIKALSVEEKNNLRSSLEYLENIEPNTVSEKGIQYVQSEIAQLCYKNNVYDFNIATNEQSLIHNVNSSFGSYNLNSCKDLMQAIFEIFIQNIETSNENFQRMANLPTRKFYSMFLEWRTKGSSYKQMINKFLSHWENLSNKIVYAGSKWGEIAFDEKSFKTLYVDLNRKTEAEKVNLAIVRIKEEQDYVDNNLIKYIEILNDLGRVNNEFYEKIKYGTSDKSIICLLKNGFSLDLARCVSRSEYSSFINIDLISDEVEVRRGIVEEMEINGVNPILIFEVTYHLT